MNTQPVNDSRLFALAQEYMRALAMCQEFAEQAYAADEGHGTPDVAYERAGAADAALERHAREVDGLRFTLRRAIAHYAEAQRRELATGEEYRGGAA